MGHILKYRSNIFHLACLYLQMLDLAYYLSENEDGYILSMHQLSPYDFTISTSRKLKIADAEKIMVVDKYAKTQGN